MLRGFGIPLFVFGGYALSRLDEAASPELAAAFVNSLLTAATAAMLTVALALFLINAVRLSRSRSMRATVRLASVGYALPGGIIGLGLLFVLARFDNEVDALSRDWFGYSTGLLVTGSAAAVVLACTIRFLALAEGAVRSGMEKLPPNLDEAARSLGRTPLQKCARGAVAAAQPGDPDRAGAGLRRYDQGTVGDDPAAGRSASTRWRPSSTRTPRAAFPRKARSRRS